jgi:regulator of sigma E protease
VNTVVLHSLLPFFGIIVVLVLVHESGHFIAAKLSGVRVLEFGVGFPPRIAAFKFHDTEYSLNALPLGGFCRMVGEEDPTEPGSLASKPRHLRLFVLSAGALFNFLFAIVLFTASFIIPHQVPIGRAMITGVEANSPAQAAGLQTGDVIYNIDGRNVQNVPDASYDIRLHLGETLKMTVKRGTELINVNVKARWAPPSNQGPTGITIASQYPFTETQSYAPLTALGLGTRETFDSLKLARNEVISWVKGATAPQVTGPVGIVQATGEVVKEAGWKSLIEFMGLISINLAVVNILPFPFLDGGRIVFVLLEVLRRGRRIAPQKEALVHLAGLAVIMTFVVVISYFDIARIIHGQSIFR